MLDSPTLAESFGSTSSSLLMRVKAHEPAAWQRLVQLYGPLVYHWCRSAGMQPADATDLVQDVFQAVFAAIGRFQHDQHSHSFRGWLRAIARNKLRDHFRKRARTLEAAGGAVGEQQILDHIDDREMVAEQDDKQLLFQQSLELLRLEFEDQTWQVFWRVTIDGRPPDVVAADAGISVNAVYKAKSRVLSRLRAELGDLLD